MGCAVRGSGRSVRLSATSRAAERVVMVRCASAGTSAGWSERKCAPRLSRRVQAAAATSRAAAAMLRSAMLVASRSSAAKLAYRLRKSVTVADHADVRAHHGAQALRGRSIRRGAARRHQRVGEAGRRGDRAAGDVVGDARGVDHRLQQRIRSEPVGAMRARGRNLAAGPEAVDRAAAAVVHRDAAHVVVRGRRDRDDLRGGIDAGGDAACMHGRKFLGEACTQRLPRIEEGAAPGRDLGKHAAGHDVARRELGERMARRHEAFAAGVDQYRAFAAQRLGRERRRIAADHDRGRVELHEFRGRR